MRRPIVPVAALLLALAGGSAFATQEPAKPTQAKSTAKTAPSRTAPAKSAPAKGSSAKEADRSKSEMKPVGVPLVKESVQTPEQIKAQQAEWKKLEEKERADNKARREKFKALVANMAKEGVSFKRGDKPDTYRLIAPAMAKTGDATQRKAAAKALVTRIKGQMEPLLKKKITLEVYTDDKATQRVDY